ncbi:MAG: family 10 glycosylhydrolase [Chloroflexi bacterium]|nr:family 10 glycosylhydrolase [Chloroflexota bacterium]
MKEPNNRDWWQRPLRAVTLEFPAANVATIDVRAIIDEAHAGAVNMLVVFSTGYYPGGTAFYRSQIAPHYPGLGERDLLAESIEAARRNGQRVISYVASIWGNRDMFFAHPDWAQRKADGNVTSWDENFNSVAMDPVSPYREYFASVVEEISENYDVDGFYFDEPSFQSWSASKACRRAFYDEFGVELPTVENWADPIFQHFIQWRYRQIRTWRESLYAIVKRPERCIFFQGAFPLASLPSPRVISGAPPMVSFYERRFATNWQVPLAHGDDIARETEFADLLHFELYRSSLVGEPLWWYGLSLRYGQSISRGKPILVLSMMANSPFDLYGMEETELRLSVHEILANGGAPLFARYYPDRVDQGAWENVYQLMREARDLEEFLVDRESIPYVAMLVSQSTLERHEQDGRPSHLGEIKGFAKALLQQKVPFDVITEEQLNAETLARYQALILPNTSCLPDAALTAIRTYVAAGGGLLASYESGRFDETGLLRIGDDLGDTLAVEYGDLRGFQVDAYMQMGELGDFAPDVDARRSIPSLGMQQNVREAGAEALAWAGGESTVHYAPLDDQRGAPTITRFTQPNGGRAVYIAIPIGLRYLEFGVPDFPRLIAGGTRWAAGTEAPIRVRNAPLTLAVTAFRQRVPAARDRKKEDRIILHLVDSVREERKQPIIEAPIHHDITLELDVSATVQTVRSVAGVNSELNWSQAAGQLNVRLPEFHCVAILVVECAE